MSQYLIKNRSTPDLIRIRGARVHNLQNIDIDIPKGKLVVITGLSGSGKSSLAFDTLYAEGQRRYLESLSAYARQFLGVLQKPDVDKIEGISPSIAIGQKKASHNPRSTVGTITEVYDYLRLLFARIGQARCPKCNQKVGRQTINQICWQVLALPNSSEIMILGPVIRGKKGEHQGILEEIKRAGFVRVRIDNIVFRVDEAVEKILDRNKKHNIEVVVDKLIISKELEKSRLADSLKTGLKLGKGIVMVGVKNKTDLIFSEHFACKKCQVSLPELEPRLFSFNSPYGACSSCQGLGEKLEVDPKLVIPNQNLTLGEGAIFPWSRALHSPRGGRQSFFWRKLQEAIERGGFSLDIPVKELPKEAINLVLYGEKEKMPDTKYQIPDTSFEGVIPWLERRYHETASASDWARAEIEQYMKEKICEKCQGKRLRPEALAVTISKSSINDIVSLNINEAKKLLSSLGNSLSLSQKKVALPIIKEIINRLQFLNDVGLDYLSLNRKAATLASGEEQRIRLATQLGSQLTGVLYVLDEPSIGLHPRDQDRLIEALKKLRDLGNSVVVVEHDSQTINESDWVIDIGPRAGKYGGKVIFAGTPKQLLKSKTLTGDYLSGRKQVKVEKTSKEPEKQLYLTIKGARENNLKNIDVNIPLGKFVCVTGVSGSGKSSLINDILARALLKKFYRAKQDPGAHERILGVENINKAVLIDQSPISLSSRSNPATYTGAFSLIRNLFTKVKESRIRGYNAGRFSFNVKGGRCEACQGHGEIKIEMYFLPDIFQECQVCKGQRFNQETLSIQYTSMGQDLSKNIAQVLKMTVAEALKFFKNISGLVPKLKTMDDVGLGYLELGQPATSLSGGEAQRIKLATELSKRDTGKTIYILDEPTTGLHFEDVRKLVEVLRKLVDRGNTVLVIEHNLELIKNCDWIIDLGPESGAGGGQVIVEGRPQDIAKNKKSHTGKYLKDLLTLF